MFLQHAYRPRPRCAGPAGYRGAPGAAQISPAAVKAPEAVTAAPLGPSAAELAAATPVPQVPGIPWVGPLNRVSFTTMFLGITELHREFKSRSLSLELMGNRAVHMRHPEDIVHVMRTHADRYCKGAEQLVGEGLVTLPDGARHAEARAVLDPGFRAEFVKGMLPTMAAVAQELVDTMLFKAGAGPAKDVEVEELCRRATLDVLGRTAFRFDFQALAVARGASQGVELAAEAAQNGSLSGSAPRYADAVTLWDAVLGPAMLIAFDMKAVPHFVFPGYAGYQEGLRTFNQLVKTMITKRRAEGLHDGSKDLLTVMLQAQQQGNSLMTDKHIRDELMVFLLAGSDTTAELLAFACYELSRRPQLQQQVRAEVAGVLAGRPLTALTVEDTRGLKLLTACINETLRLYPAATDLAREAKVDDVVGGHFIAKGTQVVTNLYSCHRHEDFWPRPDEWLPERWLPEQQAVLGPRSPDAFMPFSTGGRACIGRYMAVLEAQVVLAVLLQRLELSPPKGGAPEVSVKQAFTLKSSQGVPVSVKPLA
ncbi:cytochrome P450 [Haematococcus lacustris]